MPRTKTVVDHTSQGPLSLTYMKAVRSCLLPVGGWSDEAFGKKSPLLVTIQRKTFSVQTLGLFLSSLHYLYQNQERINLNLFSHVFLTDGFGFLMMLKTALFNLKAYKIVLHDFVDFHLMNYRHKGPYYARMYELTNKVSNILAIFQVCTLPVSPLLFNGIPMYENYKMGLFSNPRPANLTLDSAIFFSFPGFTQEKYYYTATIINIYFSWNCSVLVIGINFLLYLMVIQIVGHIKILMVSIEELKRPKVIVTKGAGVEMTLQRYDKEENEVVHAALIEIINHHRQIVGFADKISTFFGPVLALNYFFHLVAGCILLLLCSRDPKAMVRFGFIAFIIFGELIEISVIFEFVGYMSEKLMDSIYCTPWECMDIRNQRTVNFFLQRCQTPIELTAMGIVPVGVQTMQQIIKTTLSFYAMLQSVAE